MENIKWTDMQYNVMFEPVSNIRDKASDFEKCLESDFPNKFNILPNMPNVPYSAPRMLANNMHGLSLNISAESITLTHNIVNENDEIKVSDFMNKVYSLEATLKQIQDKELFSGIILRGYMDLHENPVEYIQKHFMKKLLEREIFDLETKITFKISDKYYVNITLGNLRKNENESLLVIELDINDRYRYNFKRKESPYSEKNSMNNINFILSDILTEKIYNFLENGDLDVRNIKLGTN